MFYLIILASIISCGLAQQSMCPDIKPVPDFNFTAYIKDAWYKIGRYDTYYENVHDCSYMKFDVTDKVVNFDYQFILQNKIDHVKGELDNNNGVLYFRSDKFIGGVLPLMIIDIDYDSYGVEYLCIYDDNTNTKKEMAWVLSRTKSMDDATKTKIEDMLQNNNIIDRSKLYWDKFTDEACNVEA